MQLQVFSIDSDTFACVRLMISYHIFSIRCCGTVQGWCLIERIQWYSPVVVPESQLFLSLLLQCWIELYLLPRTICPHWSSTQEKESQDRMVSFSTKKCLDDLQMSIKCPTSKEQTCEQEAAAHLDRNSFFYPLELMVGTQCTAYLPLFCTQQLIK